MNARHTGTFLFLLLVLLLCYRSTFGWGFFAHKWINRMAVESLPVEIRPFFETHKTYLSEHSIDPDLWKRDDPDEQYRHYIDIDMYGSYPFDELPRAREAADVKFGAETVVKRGIAPWWIVHTYSQLVEAMRASKSDSVVLFAASLGHYLSDVHMPLHNVENYDGQLTGNDGIHARFERWMIEQYAEKMSLAVAPPQYVEDPLARVFEVVLSGTKMVDEILAADSQAKKAGKTYLDKEDYDAPYYRALFRACGALAEQQMSRAVQTVASFWYSAWIDAGKPKLQVAVSD